MLRSFLLCIILKGGSLDGKRRRKGILSSPKGLWRGYSWLLISAGGRVVWLVRQGWRGGGEGRGKW